MIQFCENIFNNQKASMKNICQLIRYSKLNRIKYAQRIIECNQFLSYEVISKIERIVQLEKLRKYQMQINGLEKACQQITLSQKTEVNMKNSKILYFLGNLCFFKKKRITLFGKLQSMRLKIMNRFFQGENCDNKTAYNSLKTNNFTSKNNAVERMNRYEEALEFDDLDILQIFEHADFFNRKGMLIMKKIKAYSVGKINRYEAALEFYDIAIQINPEYSFYFYNKATALTQMNRYEEALEFYEIAIQINPEYSFYFYNKATTLAQMNRYEEALEFCDIAILKNPENADYFQQQRHNSIYKHLQLMFQHK